jgi:spermidine/putrescine transport system substrate-binding protein
MKWFKSLCAASIAALSFVVPAQAQELNLFAWSEYIPQGVLDAFTKETGIKVNYEAYASNEEMLAKLLAGAAKYDVIQPSEYTVEALVKANQLAPIDHAKIPNLKHLDPAFTKLAHDPGLKHSVPWMSGTVGIVYNKQKIKEPIKGFKDVFSGKHAGRIVVVDDGREILSWVLAVQGKDINTFDKDIIAAAKPMMVEWLKQVKLYDSDSPKDALLNGDVDVGIVWSGEGAILLQEAPDKFAWLLPEEGAHRFVDNLAIPAGSQNKEAAHKFIDFILRPEISKMISDDFPYTNPNLEARKLLDEEARANIASYPPPDVKLDIFRDVGEAAPLIDELYTSVKTE